MVSEIAEGMAYIEKQNFVHCDLKCENIVLAANRVVKIIDFGCSLSRGSTFKTGQRSHLPPEAMYGNPTVSSKLDVFMFAMTLYELLFRRFPGGETLDEAGEARAIEPYPESLPLEAPDDRPIPSLENRKAIILGKLMRKCWSLDPVDRPFFGGIVKELAERSDAVMPEGHGEVPGMLGSGMPEMNPGASTTRKRKARSTLEAPTKALR